MSYVVIEGVIGVGKTALTRLMGEHLKTATLFEQFEENPFLSNFYKDRARYAFQTEVFFLLNRYRQQQAIVRPAVQEGNLVSDYLFAKTRLFAGMNLGGDERDLFDQLYDALSRQVDKPDLVVYLTASVDTLMARIFQRDRPYERSMDRGYIANLADVYEAFFDRYSETRVLKIDTENLDLIRDPKAQHGVIDQIISSAPMA
jgi:deoxyguanosine kinase